MLRGKRMEQIYTIPVNMAFEESIEASKEGVHICPFCRMYDSLEKEELDLILGASMMEPDTRIKTNEAGFCPDHLTKLFTMGKRLPLALMLESHLDQLRREITDLPLTVPGTRARARIAELEDDCYICRRIDVYFDNLLDNLVCLWKEDEEFRKKFSEQPLFCLPHYEMMLGMAKAKLPRALCRLEIANKR